MIKLVLLDFTLSFLVAFCWATLFGSPKRVLWMAGLLGGFGHCLRFVLLQIGGGLITSTLAASIMIGLLGIYCAHKVHNPPVVFTMPACITMIPGLYAYRAIINTIRLSDLSGLSASGKELSVITELAYNATLSFSLLFTLAVGISISALLFGSKSVKEIRIGKLRRHK